MVQFRMVKYHNKKYPPYIPLHLEEVAAHFDVKDISPSLPYSLHTEYSYDKRYFRNPLLEKYPSIILANKNGVPQLWKDKSWAQEFAAFLIDLTSESPAPSVIEIHPPFTDYMESVSSFIEIYRFFEDAICSAYPQTEIHIENRCGSIYRRGRFLVSTVSEITDLCSQIHTHDLALRIAFDIPQLYTAHNADSNTPDKVISLLERMKPIRPFINGVHIWGKTESNGKHLRHIGDLDTTFQNNTELKQKFLASVRELFDDGQIRNLVLEVNSRNDHLLSILSDLEDAGFQYI